MAQTLIATENIEAQWSANFFSEYVQNSRFFPYAGDGADNVFVYNKDLTKNAGESINIPLIGRLKNPPVKDNATLQGNEEKLFQAGHKVLIHMLRTGVDINRFQEQLSSIDMQAAIRQELLKWDMNYLRDEQITALMTPALDNTPYFSSTAAQRNTWLDNNLDRIRFGKDGTNTIPGNHDASLANIDATNDILTKELLSVGKRIAQKADPHIGPLQTQGNEEWYVVFGGVNPSRDLANSLAGSNEAAWTRGIDNPLFSGGNKVWDGMIFVEIPQIPDIPGVGTGGINVAPVFICGVQAVATAWAQIPKQVTNVMDYSFVKGIGLEEMRGTDKLFYNSPGGFNVQHGMVTLYVASVNDA